MIKIYKTVFFFSAILLVVFYFNTSVFAQNYDLKNLHIFKGNEDNVIVSQQMGRDANGNIFSFSTFKGSFIGEKDSFSSASSGNSDIIITRFSTNGEISRNIHIQYATFDKATDIAINKNNDIYISGSFQNSFIEDSSTILLKCDPNGKVIWNLKVSDRKCMGQSVCTDDEGNCYVTGYIGDSLCIENYKFKSDKKINYGSFIIKLNPEGKILWINTSFAEKEKVDASEMKFENIKPHLHAIRMDKHGNIYVIGHFSGHAKLGSFDIFTTRDYGDKISGYRETYYLGKLNKHGEVLWLTNEKAEEKSYADKLIVDKEGNIYIDVYNPRFGAIDKYNTNGIWQWRFRKSFNDPIAITKNRFLFLSLTGIFNSNKDTLLNLRGKLEFKQIFAIADDSNYIYLKSTIWQNDSVKIDEKYITGPAVIITRLYFSVLKPTPYLEDSATQLPDIINTFNFYPNPADQIINIDLNSENEEKININISDLQGRILFNSNPFKPIGKVNFNIPMYKFRAGMYILQVKAGEKLYKEKLVKL